MEFHKRLNGFNFFLSFPVEMEHDGDNDGHVEMEHDGENDGHVEMDQDGEMIHAQHYLNLAEGMNNLYFSLF